MDVKRGSKTTMRARQSFSLCSPLRRTVFLPEVKLQSVDAYVDLEYKLNGQPNTLLRSIALLQQLTGLYIDILPGVKTYERIKYQTKEQNTIEKEKLKLRSEMYKAIKQNSNSMTS